MQLHRNLVQFCTKIRIDVAFNRNLVQICTKLRINICIRSAYRMDDDTKREQELTSLKRIDDSFRKVVIVGDDISPWTDDNGITFIGLFQFLRTGLPM